MPTMYDAQTGQPVEVPHAEVGKAMASGRLGFREGQVVQFRDASGQVYDVDAAQVGTELGKGALQIATDEDVRQYDLQKEHGGLGGQLQAGAEAAARTALDIGAAPLRMSGTLSEEELANLSGGKALAGLIGGDDPQAYEQEQRARTEANPGATFAGEMLLALVPGAGIAGRAASALRGTGTAAKALGTAGLLGAEGAVWGNVASAEQAWKEDAPLTAEQMWADTGMGALFGVGTAGLGFAASRASGAVERTGKRATEATRKRLEALFGKAEGRADEAFDATQMTREGFAEAAALGAKDPDLVRELAKHDDLREIVRDPKARIDVRKNALYEDVGELHGAVDDVLEARQRAGGIKWADTAKRLMDDAEAGAVDLSMAKRHVDSMLNDTEATLTKWLKQQDGLERSVVKTLAENMKSVRRLRESVKADVIKAGKVTPTNLAKAIVSADQVKTNLIDQAQMLARASRKQGSVAAQQQAKLVPEFLADSEKLRTFLENDTVLGSFAVAQKEINAPFHQLLKTKMEAEDIFGYLSRETKGGPTGRRMVKADSERIGSYIDNLDEFRGRSKRDLFARYRADLEDTVRAVQKHHPERAARAESALETLGRIDDTLNKAKAEKDLIAKFTDQVASESGTIGAGIGAAAGFAFAGPVGAALGSALGGALSRPTKTLMALDGLVRTKNRVAERMNLSVARAVSGNPEARPGKLGRAMSGARRTVARAAYEGKRAAKTAGRVGRVAAVRSLPFGEKQAERRENFKKTTDGILKLTSNPEHATETLAAVAKPVSAMPAVQFAVTQKAMVAASFLASKIPQALHQDNLTPQLDPKYVPAHEVMKFERYVETVQNPLTALEDLERGRLTHEQVEALQAVYPEMYQQIRASVFEQLTQLETPPPQRLRLQLGMLLDLPTDPSLTPEFKATMTRVMQETDPAQDKPAPSAQKPAPQIASAFDTGLGAAERRLAMGG